MTAVLFWTSLLAAYGPGVAMFALFVSPSAHLVLISLASAFFWLVAQLMSSVIWFLAIYEPRLATIGHRHDAHWLLLTAWIAVTCQELVRVGYVRVQRCVCFRSSWVD